MCKNLEFIFPDPKVLEEPTDQILNSFFQVKDRTIWFLFPEPLPKSYVSVFPILYQLIFWMYWEALCLVKQPLKKILLNDKRFSFWQCVIFWSINFSHFHSFPKVFWKLSWHLTLNQPGMKSQGWKNLKGHASVWYSFQSFSDCISQLCGYIRITWGALQNIDVRGGVGKERVGWIKRNSINIYTLTCIYTTMYHGSAQLHAHCNDLEVWDGGRGHRREAQEGGGYMYPYSWSMLLYSRKTNTIL